MKAKPRIHSIDIHFEHAYSFYELGTNENFNGLLRWILCCTQLNKWGSQKRVWYAVEVFRMDNSNIHEEKQSRE